MTAIWKQPVSVESLTAIHVATTVAHLGIEFLEVGDDFIRARAPVDSRTRQPMGILHGGVSVLLAEALGSCAAASAAPAGSRAVGLDINANHVRSASSGWVTGITRPIHIGRSTHVWQIELSDEQGQLTCVSRITMAILPMPAPSESVAPPRVDAVAADLAAQVGLREITADTVRSIIALTVADSQKGFVAPNATSLAQALFAPDAWYRAVYLGAEPVGFVMLEDESLRAAPPAQPSVSVWRFMIDARFQRKGIGRAALRRVIEHVRGKGSFAKLALSYVPGPGCPEAFYLGLGFRHTGRVDGHEIVLELALA